MLSLPTLRLLLQLLLPTHTTSKAITFSLRSDADALTTLNSVVVVPAAPSVVVNVKAAVDPSVDQVSVVIDSIATAIALGADVAARVVLAAGFLAVAVDVAVARQRPIYQPRNLVTNGRRMTMNVPTGSKQHLDRSFANIIPNITPFSD